LEERTAALLLLVVEVEEGIADEAANTAFVLALNARQHL